VLDINATTPAEWAPRIGGRAEEVTWRRNASSAFSFPWGRPDVEEVFVESEHHVPTIQLSSTRTGHWRPFLLVHQTGAFNATR
jgi:hypothetical protein